VYTENQAELGLAGLRAAAAPAEDVAVMEALDRSVARSRELDDTIVYIQALEIRAEERWRRGLRDEAIADWTLAMVEIEGLRDLMVEAEARTSVFADWASTYRRMAGVALRGADPDDRRAVGFAWDVNERMRSRELLDVLDMAGATPRPTEPAALVAARDGVLAAIGPLREKMWDGEASQSDVDALVIRERELRRAIADANPRFASTRLPDLATVDEVQAALSEDEAMLSFQIGSATSYWDTKWWGGSHVVVLTRGGTRVVQLESEERLAPAIEMYTRSIDARGDADATAGVALYELLMRRVLDELPESITTLVLVTDGALHRAPFGALRAAVDAPTVGDRYTIVRKPCAGSVARARCMPATRPRRRRFRAARSPRITSRLTR
jgi:hypothetical protein